MPIAVAPSAAVLPIRQTSTQTRPAGISLPVPPASAPDAFHPAPSGGGPVPLAVPTADGVLAPPMAPPELAAPVTPTLDPAEWGLDIEAAPATGRRRGAEDDTATGTRRPGTNPGVPLPARLFGRGKAGAARMLVLALVVGAEGVAVTSMAGHARTVPVPVDPSTATISGAYALAAMAPSALPATTVLDGAAERQQAAVAAQDDAEDLAQAQDASAKAKVTSALQQAKAAADRVKAAADRRERAMRNAQKDPKAVARVLAAERGWGADQFSCLTSLWNRESMWRFNAQNPSSSAYGIPQALPGSKMASAGPDWRTDARTQITWGLSYIADRYGSPCSAWSHSRSYNWY